MDVCVIDAKLQEAYRWANQALKYAQETQNSASQVAVCYQLAVICPACSDVCCTTYCNAIKAFMEAADVVKARLFNMQ